MIYNSPAIKHTDMGIRRSRFHDMSQLSDYGFSMFNLG